MRRGDFPPPREVNPRVAQALEAIVLKSMALRPSDRYPTAQALADEVERWLADEPITAWREPLRERARRRISGRPALPWPPSPRPCSPRHSASPPFCSSRRVPTPLKSANLELAAANQRASDANRDLLLANTRERARFELSLEAIKTFHAGVSEDLLLKEKQFGGLRTKLLRGATDFYDRLEGLLAGQADHRSRAALGQAYHDIGELTARIGSQADALAALKRGTELRLALATEADADAGTTLNAAQSLIAVGDLQEATGEPEGALASFKQARDLLEPLAQNVPESHRFRAAVAKCLHGIARVEYNSGRAQEALAAHEQARTIRQSLAVSSDH